MIGDVGEPPSSGRMLAGSPALPVR
jgi:hypothetical protein